MNGGLKSPLSTQQNSTTRKETDSFAIMFDVLKSMFNTRRQSSDISTCIVPKTFENCEAPYYQEDH